MSGDIGIPGHPAVDHVEGAPGKEKDPSPFRLKTEARSAKLQTGGRQNLATMLLVVS